MAGGKDSEEGGFGTEDPAARWPWVPLLKPLGQVSRGPECFQCRRNTGTAGLQGTRGSYPPTRSPRGLLGQAGRDARVGSTETDSCDILHPRGG